MNKVCDTVTLSTTHPNSLFFFLFDILYPVKRRASRGTTSFATSASNNHMWYNNQCLVGYDKKLSVNESSTGTLCYVSHQVGITENKAIL